jgi:hypothetical protein
MTLLKNPSFRVFSTLLISSLVFFVLSHGISAHYHAEDSHSEDNEKDHKIKF